MSKRQEQVSVAKQNSGAAEKPVAADPGYDGNDAVTAHEVDDIEDRAGLRAPVIYEIVRREGELEMDRPVTSLWWSGLAAGLSISFSPLARTIIHIHLPATVWRPLVSALGYPVGFLIVILARQQLFTENTITVVLPLMAKFTTANLRGLGRMWSVVLMSNLVGTFIAALFCRYSPVLDADITADMLGLARQLMQYDWPQMFFKGIATGFLIATMVWLIPSAEGARFHVVAMVTYLIAAGGFTHIIAGSFEGFLLVLYGQFGIWQMLTQFSVPVLLGNVIGGTALFALLSYAQVMSEI